MASRLLCSDSVDFTNVNADETRNTGTVLENDPFKGYVKISCEDGAVKTVMYEHLLPEETQKEKSSPIATNLKEKLSHTTANSKTKKTKEKVSPSTVATTSNSKTVIKGKQKLVKKKVV